MVRRKQLVNKLSATYRFSLRSDCIALYLGPTRAAKSIEYCLIVLVKYLHFDSSVLGYIW